MQAGGYMRKRCVLMVALCLAGLGLSAAAPLLADTDQEEEAAADARSRVDDAYLVVRRMKRDHKLARLLARSRGVLIIPHYGKGGFIVGGGGGPALLFVHRGGSWVGPVFYSVSGVSFGLQAGVATGPVAMLLMNERPIALFEDHTSKWSMGTDAGLTVVKYGGSSDTESGYSDVIVWTGLEGLYGGVSVGANNITVNADSDRGYYHRDLTPRQILAGTVSLSHGQRIHVALEGIRVVRRVHRRASKAVARAK